MLFDLDQFFFSSILEFYLNMNCNKRRILGRLGRRVGQQAPRIGDQLAKLLPTTEK